MNLALAEQVYRQVTEHPESHDPWILAAWEADGLRASIEGWVLLLSGRIVVWPLDGPADAFLPTMTWDDVHDMVAEALCVQVDEAVDLWWPGNRVEAARRLADLIAVSRHRAAPERRLIDCLTGDDLGPANRIHLEMGAIVGSGGSFMVDRALCVVERAAGAPSYPGDRVVEVR